METWTTIPARLIQEGDTIALLSDTPDPITITERAQPNLRTIYVWGHYATGRMDDVELTFNPLDRVIRFQPFTVKRVRAKKAPKRASTLKAGQRHEVFA